MIIKHIVIFFLLAFLSSCSSSGLGWLGFKEYEEKLKGERISILDTEGIISNNNLAKGSRIVIPEAQKIDDWPQQNRNSLHSSANIDLSNDLRVFKKTNAGKGENDETRILSQPVIIGNNIFSLDASATLRAFNLTSQNLIWRIDLRPENEKRSASIGGGLAANKQKIFVSTSYGEIFSINIDTGQKDWKKNIGFPIRAAPTLVEDKILILTLNNKLLALGQNNGEELWRHEGSYSLTTLMTTPTPAADSDIVVVPYSNGEVFALRLNNGSEAWSDSLVDTGKIDVSNELTDIDAGPVIEKEMIIVASVSGKLVAIDRRTGLRLWEKKISTTETPVVIGNSMFLVTLSNEVVCIDKLTGNYRWVTSLSDGLGKKAKGRWFSPLLLRGKLIIAGGEKLIIRMNPADGIIEKVARLPGYPASSAIASSENLLILTRDSDIISLK